MALYTEKQEKRFDGWAMSVSRAVICAAFACIFLSCRKDQRQLSVLVEPLNDGSIISCLFC